MENRERQQRVEYGSSIHAIERPLSRIKLTFTSQGSLVPQQPMSVSIPERAILVVDFVGTGGGIESEMVVGLNRKPWCS